MSRIAAKQSRTAIKQPLRSLGTTPPPGPVVSAVSYPWTCPSPFLPPIASSIGKGWRVGPNPHGEPCPGSVSLVPSRWDLTKYLHQCRVLAASCPDSVHHFRVLAASCPDSLHHFLPDAASDVWFYTIDDFNLIWLSLQVGLRPCLRSEVLRKHPGLSPSEPGP